MLREVRLLAVSTRSPRPERPIRVSRRPPSASPSRASSARPRVTIAARAFSPRPLPATMPAAIASTFLSRAADLDADHVLGPVGAKAAAAQRLGQLASQGRIGAAERRGGRQALRHLAGEVRPRQHGARALPGIPRRPPRSGGRRSRSRSPWRRSPGSSASASARQTARTVCAGTVSSTASAAAASPSIGGRPDRRVERDLRQVARDWHGAASIAADDRRVARPHQHLAAGARGGLRQRRAPGAGADDGDRLDGHAPSFLRWRAASRARDALTAALGLRMNSWDDLATATPI